MKKLKPRFNQTKSQQFKAINYTKCQLYPWKAKFKLASNVSNKSWTVYVRPVQTSLTKRRKLPMIIRALGKRVNLTRSHSWMRWVTSGGPRMHHHYSRGYKLSVLNQLKITSIRQVGSVSAWALNTLRWSGLETQVSTRKLTQPNLPADRTLKHSLLLPWTGFKLLRRCEVHHGKMLLNKSIECHCKTIQRFKAVPRFRR